MKLEFQKPEKSKNDYLNDTIQFLKKIGIECKFSDEAIINKSFLKNILIKDGNLIITPSVHIGDLLHEAGHLACIPGEYRKYANNDLDDLFAAIFEDTKDYDPEHPINQAFMQCSDVEATAWGWAAGKHLNLPEQQIIGNSFYSGDGANVRIMLGMKRYIGINGLKCAGFMSSISEYPRLTQWVQKDFGTQPFQNQSDGQSEEEIERERNI